MPSSTTPYHAVHREQHADQVLETSPPVHARQDPDRHDRALAKLALPGTVNEEGQITAPTARTDNNDSAPKAGPVPLAARARLHPPSAHLVTTRQRAEVTKALAHTVTAPGTLSTYEDTGHAKTLDPLQTPGVLVINDIQHITAPELDYLRLLVDTPTTQTSLALSRADAERTLARAPALATHILTWHHTPRPEPAQDPGALRLFHPLWHTATDTNLLHADETLSAATTEPETADYPGARHNDRFEITDEVRALLAHCHGNASALHPELVTHTKTTAETKPTDANTPAADPDSPLPTTTPVPSGTPPAAIPLPNPVPSLSTFLRTVRRDLTAGKRADYRKGPETARALDVSDKHPRTRPNHIWETDHLQAPLRVESDDDLVHPYVTWFTDCATKTVTGLAINPGHPTQASTLAALRSAALRTKPYGLLGRRPEQVRIDRGKDLPPHHHHRHRSPRHHRR